MIVKLAKYAGYCFGVKRAVNMALKAAEKGKVYSAGPIIHNDFVIAQLQKAGVFSVTTAEEVPEGSTVIIRAHGLPPDDILKFQQRKCNITDATCPNVEKIHAIVERESAQGRKILIIGKANHPEVLGIAARCKEPTVAENSDQILDFSQKNAGSCFSVVCQTTFQREKCDEFINILKNTCKCAYIFDTICRATELRQNEAICEAKGSNGVIVIGDDKSSNSKNLYELCKSRCENTIFISDIERLCADRFHLCDRLFITAGASTPDPIIKEVYLKMTDEEKTTTGESFEELLEQSLKTLHTGEKVTGIVTQINATDISVDLGVKQAGYVPLTEISDDPTFDIAENIKVGDEIEAYVVRVNDIEGYIMLSKKRLDAVKNWEKLEAAIDSKEPMTGIVVDQNKGGIVANVLGIRVFIPASQTGLPREATFDSMMKTTQKIRITEVNRQRRRVVGSIKALMFDARREASERIWKDIAVGTKYKGVVKSFTSYGAFVDIGGVDGMVHISELSWSRVKHPSDVLTLGQEIEVYVIALDDEKKKISLGYKVASENPWEKFISQYKVGDVANVKIVKFMPFGAFAEVMPGVDGLIHISQISDRRIARAEEVLKAGEQVDAKIIGIDEEKKKISLSIRALTDPTVEVEVEIEDAPADNEEQA